MRRALSAFRTVSRFFVFASEETAAAFLHVAGEGQATVSSTLRAIGRGNWYTAKWELTALEAIGVITSDGFGPDDEQPSTVIWRLADPYQDLYASVASLFSALSTKGES
jgi:hypothetical protein